MARKPINPDPTLAEYADYWFEWHPRSESTDRANRSRLNAAFAIDLEGKLFGEYRISEVKRWHVHAVLDALLKQGRAASGTRSVLAALSTMFSDAVDIDELIEFNPFLRVRLNSNDPRIQKPSQDTLIWSLDQMREFARAGGDEYEPMIRLMSDCGLRLGEVFGLTWDDVDLPEKRIHCKGAVYSGRFRPGDSQRKVHVRTVPLPEAVAALLAQVPERFDTDLVFAAPRGRAWHHSHFYEDVWRPIRERTGLEITPHAMRHSWESHLAAAGIDHADLAKMAGHSLETMIRVYTHPLNKSEAAVREALA